MTRTVRRSLAASAAALSLLAVAGCGGNDDAKASDESTTSASTSTSPSTSASESASASTSEGPSDDSSADSGGAAAGSDISAEDFAALLKSALDQATTANVTTTNSAAGLTGKGQVDYTGDTPSVAMTATIAQLGDIEVRLVDKILYLKGAVFGGKFVKISLDDPNNPLGALGDSFDPASAFATLTKGITKATYVGEEDVDGDTLKHYTASVDTKVLLQSLPAEAQSQATLPPSVDYQWWFDEDGFFRKFSADLGTTAGTVEGTFDDWGTKVDIAAPPADQVTEMPGA